MSTPDETTLKDARVSERVRMAYDFFDLRRKRSGPFDEGDEQNVHAWMRAVTEWIEKQEADRA